MNITSLLKAQAELSQSLLNDYDSIPMEVNNLQLRARQRTIVELGNTVLDLLEDDSET